MENQKHGWLRNVKNFVYEYDSWGLRLLIVVAVLVVVPLLIMDRLMLLQLVGGIAVLVVVVVGVPILLKKVLEKFRICKYEYEGEQRAFPRDPGERCIIM
jgi:hypothetical protein